MVLVINRSVRHEIWYWVILLKSSKIPNLVQIVQKHIYIRYDLRAFLHVPSAKQFLEPKIFPTNAAEKTETRIICLHFPTCWTCYKIGYE
jgi:hypothetical protein